MVGSSEATALSAPLSACQGSPQDGWLADLVGGHVGEVKHKGHNARHGPLTVCT